MTEAAVKWLRELKDTTCDNDRAFDALMNRLPDMSRDCLEYLKTNIVDSDPDDDKFLVGYWQRRPGKNAWRTESGAKKVFQRTRIAFLRSRAVAHMKGVFMTVFRNEFKVVFSMVDAVFKNFGVLLIKKTCHGSTEESTKTFKDMFSQIRGKLRKESEDEEGTHRKKKKKSSVRYFCIDHLLHVLAICLFQLSFCSEKEKEGETKKDEERAQKEEEEEKEQEKELFQQRRRQQRHFLFVLFILFKRIFWFLCAFILFTRYTWRYYHLSACFFIYPATPTLATIELPPPYSQVLKEKNVLLLSRLLRQVTSTSFF